MFVLCLLFTNPLVSRPEVVWGDQIWLQLFCVVVFFVLRMNVCCAGFSSFSTSQEIGWEERFQDDLFCVEWVRKTQTQYSVTDLVKLNICITEGWMVHCINEAAQHHTITCVCTYPILRILGPICQVTYLQLHYGAWHAVYYCSANISCLYWRELFSCEIQRLVAL